MSSQCIQKLREVFSKSFFTPTLLWPVISSPPWSICHLGLLRLNTQLLVMHLWCLEESAIQEPITVLTKFPEDKSLAIEAYFPFSYHLLLLQSDLSQKCYWWLNHWKTDFLLFNLFFAWEEILKRITTESLSLGRIKFFSAFSHYKSSLVSRIYFPILGEKNQNSFSLLYNITVANFGMH